MLRPINLAALLLALLPGLAPAQTVRFLTSVGDFYLELNPTDNPNLSEHVDNLLAYVGTGRYHGVVVNRAAEGFVLQLGAFTDEGVTPSTLPPSGFPRVDRFDPVIVDQDGDGRVDFDTTGLTNTAGRASLALSGDPNSGTNSFFVNLDDNSFLDDQGFVPFAQVTDLADLDAIMNQPQVDLRNVVGVDDPNYSDIPLTDDGDFVILESVMVIDQPFLNFAGPIRRIAGLEVDGQLISTAPELSSSESAAIEGERLFEQFIPPPTGGLGLSASATPEPSSMVLLAGAAVAGVRRRRR